jgi:adenylate cyclase
MHTNSINTADTTNAAKHELCKFFYHPSDSSEQGTTVPDGERRLVAIMFTDMVGYTALGQKDESLSLALVEEQRKLIRPILGRHNGREIKTMGDAFLVEFPNALDAVRCAYDIQRATREFNISLPEEKRIHLRVGLHLGDVVESQGDISGDAVNLASRIEPLAEDGGVCLTRQVYDHVQNKFELPLASLGPRSLKNVASPVEVYRIMMPWEGRSHEVFSGLDKRRIAILPFANISPDPADEFFADGMTEELISTLSRIRGLRVIARTSVMGYKGGHKKIGEVAKELGVGTVLEGSVRKAGRRMRITVQLIDSETSEHIWAESYDRELTDVFAIQSDISTTVASSLRVQLLSEERSALERKRVAEPEAYTLYLKGRSCWNARTKQSVTEAVQLFSQATRIDPKFALAYTGLADCYSALAGFDWMAPSAAYPLAKEFSMKALKIDESLAEAHASLAVTLKNQLWDFASAERELRRAVELSPSYALAYHWLAGVLGVVGKIEQAVSYEKRGVEIDPYSPAINTGLAYWLAVSGRIDEALEQHKRAVDLDPNYIPSRIWKSEVHIALSEYDAAIREAERAVEIEKTPPTELNLAWVYASVGRRDEARTILEDVMSRAAREQVCPVAVAMVELAMGGTDEGFGWLKKALEDRDDCLLDLVSDHWFRQYRSDPRWKEICAGIGLSAES